jgi:hypothetical protein
MIRCMLLSTATLFGTACLFAAPAPKGIPSPCIDLNGYINVKLDDTFHSGDYENYNLKSLGTGKQKLGGMEFDIAGVMQLGSSRLDNKPEKIEGIKVGRTVKKLHFLHATGYQTEADTVVAKYVIRYADKTTAEAEVVYGRDVVDWWAYPDQQAPTKGKAIWEGENDASKGFNAKIKLYLMSWDNPKPDKEVATIDFIAPNLQQPAAPFCVAITAEEK